MKVRSTILLMGLLLFISCSGPKNDTLREAEEVHLKTVESYIEIKKDLNKRKKTLQDDIAATNPSQTERINILQGYLRGFDKSERILENWENSLIGVPDMGTHNHGTDSLGQEIVISNEEVPSRLSDAEVLTLQKELSRTLIEIEKQIKKDVYGNLEKVQR